MNVDNAKLFNAKYEQEELNEFLLRSLMDKMGENIMYKTHVVLKRKDQIRIQILMLNHFTSQKLLIVNLQTVLIVGNQLRKKLFKAKSE